MQLSSLGRRFIQEREGLRLTAYPDGKNADGSPRYSIGYGHNGVPKGLTITRAQAEALFVEDVAKYEAAVNEIARTSARPTTQKQFDALVSFAYNVGTAGAQGSSVARLHRAGETAAAADALRAWVRSGGEVSPVLEARRELERALYLGGGYGVSVGPELAAPSGSLSAAVVVAVGTYFLLRRVPTLRRAFA